MLIIGVNFSVGRQLRRPAQRPDPAEWPDERGPWKPGDRHELDRWQHLGRELVQRPREGKRVRRLNIYGEIWFVLKSFVRVNLLDPY